MPKSVKSTKHKNKPDYEVSCGNIFADLGFGPEEAVNLSARAELMIFMRGHINSIGLSQRQASAKFGIPQPRIAEIMTLKIDKFSVDQLLKYLSYMGMQATFDIKPLNAK